MRYTYRGLSGKQIDNVFGGCVPCNCYQDPDKIYKVPRYDVDVKYGTTSYGNGSTLISEITVECDCCGARERYDVERRDIYSGDLPW